MDKNTYFKYTIFLTFLAMMPLANYFIGNIGTKCIEDGPCLIPVGLGWMAPSGVLFIGVSLVLRDMLQEMWGWKVTILAVVIGAIVSYYTSNPYVAVASAVSFFIAEVLDTGVYTPLRKYGATMAVFFSGIVGAFFDSMLFMYVAFGSLDFSFGNFLGKIYATVAATIFVYFFLSKKETPV
jgi:uncharacterized PurR-regulated membrane protein YhhQ (DUF165 family)